MNIQLLNKNISDIKADILVEFLTPDTLKEHTARQSKILLVFYMKRVYFFVELIVKKVIILEVQLLVWLKHLNLQTM